uniref:F-box domain-containing protein n=1 Tax=Meloidogyne hapla TaxID=6305 RepID=A0A1I8BJZ6_MELHA
MESLLYGQIIDTLKCLDFNQLFALKQTNKYFKTLIGRYEHLLTRKEFKRIHIVIVNEEEQKNYKIIDLGIGVFNLKLNNKVEEKWQSAIDKEIPVYLNTDEYPLNSKEIVIELNIGEDRESENILILKLPVFPKNIEEMKIIYCWLFHLFNYAYCDAEFFTFIFNPEFIQLLFEENNEENIQTKLNIKNNLEESKDCSKIVAKIFINFKDCPRINLIIRAEDIKKAQKGDRHYIKYELSNIYNPNVRYSIINVEENGLMKNVIIQRINLFLNYFV